VSIGRVSLLEEEQRQVLQHDRQPERDEQDVLVLAVAARG
jgi:hypothetical protein